MPVDKNGQPWDPKTMGAPTWWRLGGLPSMWFTSRKAYDDLRLWISSAMEPELGVVISKIFPEEAALLAIEDAEYAEQLSYSLWHAKLYDAVNNKFMTREPRREVDLE